MLDTLHSYCTVQHILVIIVLLNHILLLVTFLADVRFLILSKHASYSHCVYFFSKFFLLTVIMLVIDLIFLPCHNFRVFILFYWLHIFDITVKSS